MHLPPECMHFVVSVGESVRGYGVRRRLCVSARGALRSPQCSELSWRVDLGWGADDGGDRGCKEKTKESESEIGGEAC
jgi:hypothetical protein